MEQKEKRCLKFTGYIYLPSDMSEKELKYFLRHPRPGRIIIYDEFNNVRNENSKAFDNLSLMNEFLEDEFRLRSNKIIKKTKKVV